MKGVLFVRNDKELLNNKIFSGVPIYGMKTDNYMYIHFRKSLMDAGMSLDTQDILPPEDADFIICLNETAFFQTYKRSSVNKFIYLILSEPPVYNYKDWQASSHQVFDKVFTYDSDRVDGRKYFHYTFPIDFVDAEREIPNPKAFHEKKHCVIVAGAISVTRQDAAVKSLLYERFRAIKWFNDHAPNDLDFFARTHPLTHCSCYKGAGVLKKLSPLMHNRVSEFIFKRSIAKVFKGALPAENKVQYLNGYKFSICFENTIGIKGLISEKIFDCFMALNIPIYAGAPDINNLIPENCMIQFSQFKNYKELNNYLHSLTENDFNVFQENITNFLKGEAIKQFGLEAYSQLLLSHILIDQ